MKLKEEHLGIPSFGAASGVLMMTRVEQRQMVMMSVLDIKCIGGLFCTVFGLEMQSEVGLIPLRCVFGLHRRRRGRYQILGHRDDPLKYQD